MSEFYVAVLARNSEGTIFVTMPDMPGVNAAADTEKEALAYAIEFANDYVADLVGDGHPVPKARSLNEIEVEEGEEGRALIPVEVPGNSVKISISIDEALLARVDRVATAGGTSRSAFIAEALGAKLRASRADAPIDQEEAGVALSAIRNLGAHDPMLVVPLAKQAEGSLFNRIIRAFGEKEGLARVDNDGFVFVSHGGAGRDLVQRAASEGAGRKVRVGATAEGRAPRKR